MPFPVNVALKDFAYTRRPRWGDVYWYDFGTPRAQQHTMAEPHLAVVVSDTHATMRGTVLIVPLSGSEHRRANYVFHVVVTRVECPKLDKESIVKVDQIYCVPDQGLPDQYYLASLDRKTMTRIYGPLLRVLGANYLLQEGLLSEAS